MNHTTLSQVSDYELQQEYIKRFTLVAGDTIQSAQDAVLHLRTYFSNDPYREKFVMLLLNGRNQVISTETLIEGTLTTSAVYPREVIRQVLNKGAVVVLIAHNHPSGNPNPSKDDIEITKRLKEVCGLIDVTIHDHLIIAGDDYTSFADMGLM